MTARRRNTDASSGSLGRSVRWLERRSWRVGIWLVAVGLTAMFGFPLLWMLISSFRPVDDILSHLYPWTLDTMVPRSLTLENYARLIDGGFLRGVWNTIVASAWTIAAGLAVCVPAAFALGVLRFGGRSAVFALLVGAFIVPFDVLAFPLSSVVARVGLRDTVIALVLPLAANGFAIFLLRQFFMAIPRSLYEAARVDGASSVRVLWSIYIPLSRPALIGAGILFFVSQWQAFLWPLLVAPTQESQVAAVRLALLWQPYSSTWGQILAGATLLFLLPALVILFFQRYFVASVAATGLSE